MVRHVLRGAEALAHGAHPVVWPKKTDTHDHPPDAHTDACGFEPTDEAIEEVIRYMEPHDFRLRQRNPELVSQIREAMSSQLGAELAAKLDRYVKVEHKRHIKVFGDKGSPVIVSPVTVAHAH